MSMGLMWPEEGEPAAEAIYMEPAQQEAVTDVQAGAQPKKSVVTIRGAKLANSDKNPANPFSVEHLTEAQERERGLLGADRGKGIIGTDPTKAVNSGAAGEASAGKKKSSGSGGEHVVEDVSPVENIKLIGVLGSEDRSVAIIGVGNNQVSLAVGEQDGGVELLSLSGETASVKDSCGKIHNLNL